MGWGWDWYPKAKPRRPANGIKAQSGSKFGKTWWASQWLDALEKLVDPGRLSRGRSYARSGQVLNIDIKPGHIDSRVQGSQPRPYKVDIDIKPLSEKEWARVADAMAAQAIFAAKLLAGEMPQDIEKAFASAKVNLFPASQGDLETECSCPDWSNPCKHIAAVYYLLGEQFDSDPFLLFRLRGKGKDEIIAMLRERRSMPEAQPEAETRAAPRAKKAKPSRPALAIPLNTLLDRFWDAADRLEDFSVEIDFPDVDAIPVKRLGEPKFWHNKTDFITLLGRAYQSVSEKSIDTALGTNVSESEEE